MAWSQTLLSPLVKSCYTIQRKSKFFSLPMSPLYVLPLFGRVRGCVASFGKGQSPLCPSRRIQAGFGPLSRRFGEMPIRGMCRPLTALRGMKRKAG